MVLLQEDDFNYMRKSGRNFECLSRSDDLNNKIYGRR